jgi:hypothetical protein
MVGLRACGVTNMESVHSGNDGGAASPGTLQISADAVSALHAALRDGCDDRDPISSPAVSDALCQICGEAKRKNWPPERLLIAFKATLEILPAVGRLSYGPGRDILVARLVSQCICEYYRDSRR